MYIEYIRQYIYMILCVAIVIAILQLITPNSKMKKYIYSLLGVIMTISMISPIINVYNEDKLKQGINEVIDVLFSQDKNSDYDSYIDGTSSNTSMVKKEFVKKIENDLINNLKKDNIDVTSVDITLSQNYIIQDIEVRIKGDTKISITDDSILKKVNIVSKYINEIYKVEFENIRVVTV